MTLNEPSVEDTISILRGLRDRFESHHGVQVLDSALVAAAKLSDRYIQDRFQPDKSIDLLDEALASLRVALDSRPGTSSNCQCKFSVVDCYRMFDLCWRRRKN